MVGSPTNGRPTSPSSDFHRLLSALTAEYERLRLENSALRKELKGEVSISPTPPTWALEDGDVPVPPTCTSPTKRSCTATLEVPGCVAEMVHSELPEEDESWAPLEPDGPPPMMTNVTRGSAMKHGRVYEVDETEERANFLLMLDVVPAVVIMASAAVAGFSADIHPESIGWKVLEALFTVFFIAEILVKSRVFGCKEYVWGPDWYWSWFDILCVILALVDMTLTYISMTSDFHADTGAMSSLKMLKLARLGRIVRLLKFKIFQELKLMIQGVFTGLRVLTWAVILLVGFMYLLGVVARTLFASHEEFSSIPAAMFTSFRCFTDGCAAFDGTPLQERLRKSSDFGGLFMLSYILLFLFVTIGIFNLIMAVFIDNVTDGSTKKRQRELGQNAPKTAWVISSSLRQLIMTGIFQKEAEDEAERGQQDRRVSKILRDKLVSMQVRYGYKPKSRSEYEELTERIREEMSNRNVVVTRDEFNGWLGEEELLETLSDAEIDVSCKYDLFDVLDADLSGELEFEEMIDGLLKCRGPASKTDIIAIRLKTRHLVRMVTQICEKLRIQTT
ncbi:unnamed protein product [Effrenium voratum]|uniref:Ion transport domain-containing protein n=1 Tax=Effrenium voratum TaxID=2562239 RepID=A0AA36I6M2_9DINO|nr:unnamed protein product [Effrenium voratum]CAJ1444221.1 unnamed protein product [Effrenium voratum]